MLGRTVRIGSSGRRVTVYGLRVAPKHVKTRAKQLVFTTRAVDGPSVLAAKDEGHGPQP